MGILSKLFKAKESNVSPPASQAVIVYLDATNLPQEVYDQYDIATLEDQLIERIESGQLGEFDGNEFGAGEVVLYMYGPDAEAIFSGIEQTLLAYPLCKSARVVIRRGAPGADARELQLP